MPLIHPVLLCGGSGTRLWPLSRQSFPKQFARLTGEESLFQATARRNTSADFAAPIVVTGDPFRFVVAEQLAQVSLASAATLIEPEARNTAPAVLAAALWLAKRQPDALMIVSPSDHVIPDEERFRTAVAAARPAAEAGNIVTFGITPDRPETGYGYLELADGPEDAAAATRQLARFVEKPDAATAARMAASGRFLWNAGIFLCQAKVMIDAFGRHMPGMLADVAGALDDAQGDLGFTRLNPAPWARLQSISIDYAIMEKETGLRVMPYAGGWSDLGSWDAVWKETGPDTNGNVISAHASAIDCENTLLRSEHPGIQLVGIGLSDIVAVATSDAVLVTRKGSSQRVDEAVAALKVKGQRQATAFARDHRPWGWFESLALGSRFQVKRIVVNPGASLSLQSHRHRAEHWVVVEGVAKVTIGEDTRRLSENQSVYIPLAEKHRLENPGEQPMVLIEVQTGCYLGEDDIIRFDDIYARG